MLLPKGHPDSTGEIAKSNPEALNDLQIVVRAKEDAERTVQSLAPAIQNALALAGNYESFRNSLGFADTLKAMSGPNSLYSTVESILSSSKWMEKMRLQDFAMPSLREPLPQIPYSPPPRPARADDVDALADEVQALTEQVESLSAENGELRMRLVQTQFLVQRLVTHFELDEPQGNTGPGPQEGDGA